MKNTKVLELLNNGEIELLKTLLKNEIYTESLKGNSNAKKRYSAMKKYFVNKNENRLAFKMPCKLSNAEYSFMDGYSAVITKEKPEGIELFNKEKHGIYIDTEEIFNRQANTVSFKVNFADIIATAKTDGYKYKHGIKTHIIYYKNSFWNLSLIEKAYNIINNNSVVEFITDDKKYSNMQLVNEIGKILICGIRVSDKEKEILKFYNIEDFKE